MANGVQNWLSGWRNFGRGPRPNLGHVPGRNMFGRPQYPVPQGTVLQGMPQVDKPVPGYRPIVPVEQPRVAQKGPPIGYEQAGSKQFRSSQGGGVNPTQAWNMDQMAAAQAASPGMTFQEPNAGFGRIVGWNWGQPIYQGQHVDPYNPWQYTAPAASRNLGGQVNTSGAREISNV